MTSNAFVQKFLQLPDSPTPEDLAELRLAAQDIQSGLHQTNAGDEVVHSDIINQFAQVLESWDGKDLASLVLRESDFKVKYTGDSVYEVE